MCKFIDLHLKKYENIFFVFRNEIDEEEPMENKFELLPRIFQMHACLHEL